ncbi:MAG: RNA polymerase factor sigma-54 [Planctomycetota bacterium]
MRMEIGLSQAQVQKQILSPQMIQSMEILVLNSQQLEERIEEALEENIALEVEEPDGPDGEGAETVAEAPSTEVDPGAAAATEAAEMDLLEDRYEHLAEFQSEEYYNSPGGGLPVGGDGEEDRFEALQNAADRPESLQDHLLEQVRLRSELTDRQRFLCHEIIHSLDERGWLLYPPSEIRDALNRAEAPVSANGHGPLGAAWPPALSSNGTRPAVAEFEDEGPLDGQPTEGFVLELPVTDADIEDAWNVVRSLEPAGVGALDLRDCLILQLERDPQEYPLERELIQHHLSDIAKNRLPQIAKAVSRTIDEIKDAIEIISALDPNPGQGFSLMPTAVVRPDVFVEEVDGEFKVVVDNPHLPRLKISTYYRQLLADARKDPELRRYIKKKIDNAEWLMHAIFQRRSTLQRVAEEVVKHQQDFFRRGIRHLRPLKMQEIADKIGVNVSTVSRAISGKYFQAPGCIRDLKFLFTGGTTKDDGSTESRGSVIGRIKKLIEDEDRRRPLSDSKIVTLLGREGIHISRRTVTKYREAESIPSSRERRSY